MLTKTTMVAKCLLNPSLLGRNISTIAIIGGGVMGSGIAQVAAAAGNKVFVYDLQRNALEGTKLAIDNHLDRIGKDMFDGDTGRLAEYIRTTKSNLHYTSDSKLAFGRTDLIVEAIHENQEAKTRLFAKLEAQITDPATILSTNTVNISVSHIASQSHRKDRFIGCRFFFPVPETILSEITRTVETSDDTVNRVTEWVTKLGKIPVQLFDTPSGGGIVHRLPHFKKAIAMLARGKASMEEIDLAMKHSLGAYMGPFRTMDDIGLDVILSTLEALSKKYADDPLYTVPPLLQQLVKQGKLGVKSGEGFFSYK